mgnify:FL=1
MQNDGALSLLIDRNKKFRDILIYVEKNKIDVQGQNLFPL